jgi:hypothetical protein
MKIVRKDLFCLAIEHQGRYHFGRSDHQPVESIPPLGCLLLTSLSFCPLNVDCQSTTLVLESTRRCSGEGISLMAFSSILKTIPVAILPMMGLFSVPTSPAVSASSSLWSAAVLMMGLAMILLVGVTAVIASHQKVRSTQS